MGVKEFGLVVAMLTACAPSIDEQAAAGATGAGGSTMTAGTAGGGGGLTCPGVDLMNDPTQCGSCGHSCLGGACVAGACQPLRLGHVTAQSGFVPTSLALDPDHVYAGVNPGDSTPGGIFSLPRAGGETTTLTDQTTLLGPMMVTGSLLVWGQGSNPPGATDGLYAMATDGSSPPTLLLAKGGAFAVDGQFLYAAASPDYNKLVRLPITGGATEVLGTISPLSTAIGAVWVDGTTVIAVVNGGVGALRGYVDVFPKSGGQPMTLFRSRSIDDTEVHGEYLYAWVFGGEHGILTRYPTAGGPEQIITIDPPLSWTELRHASTGYKQFAVDDDWVYMAGCNETGICDETKPNQIHRIPVAGGADNPVNPAAFAEEIAVDDKALVWADANGDIWQLAK